MDERDEKRTSPKTLTTHTPYAIFSTVPSDVKYWLTHKADLIHSFQ